LDTLELHTTIRRSPAEAFALFHGRFGEWWPPTNTYAGEANGSPGRLTLGDGAGGLCSEIGQHGFRIDWGRVTVFEPPTRLVFLWQIAPNSVPDPNPDHASQVEVLFAAGGEGCRITISHGAFERHGEGAEAYRDEMASEYGWPLALAAYEAFAAT
jgi:uncharacterized protein YndB with AHSA1/START domain